jgi:cytochrome c oxidase subunit 2
MSLTSPLRPPLSACTSPAFRSELFWQSCSFGALLICLVCAWPLPAWAADRPMSYLGGAGPVAVVPLTWGLLGISIAVVVIIAILVLAGTLLRWSGTRIPIGERLPIEYAGHGLRWIFIGVGVSALVLSAAMIWTFVVLADVNGPPSPPTVSLRITGYQWWWKVEYLNKDPSRTFVTANEI